MNIKYKALPKEKESQYIKDLRELEDLKKWFNDYYTIHYQKYIRLIELKLKDGIDPKVLLINLYDKAEQVRSRINEIEELYGINIVQK